MFPWKIERPKTEFPYLTLVLIAINTAVFIITYYSPNLKAIYSTYGLRWGWAFLWTWLTSMFMHASWFHLLSNMLFLLVFGSLIEDVLPRYKYLLVYLAGGLIAAFLQSIVIIAFSSRFITMVGASGAIAALLGVIMLRFKKNKVTWYANGVIFFPPVILILPWLVQNGIPLWQVLFWFWPIFTISAFATGVIYMVMQLIPGLLQIASGNMGGVAYWAHIGGLLGGLIIAKQLNLGEEAEDEYSEEAADSLFRLGDYKDAAEKYQKLIDKNGQKPELMHKAAKSLALDGQKEKSTCYFIKTFNIYNKLGLKDDAAIVYDDMRKLLSDYRFDVKTEYMLASFAQSHNKFLEAIGQYQKIIDYYDGTREAEFAMLGMAQVYKKMGDANQEKQILEKYSEKYPDSQWVNFG